MVSGREIAHLIPDNHLTIFLNFVCQVSCLRFLFKLKQINNLRWGEERAAILLSFTRNFVVSVQRSFLFLWVLGKGRVTLLSGIPWAFHITSMHITHPVYTV